MLKYYLLTLCCCIFRVQGIDLEFTGCNTNGWLCQNSTSGIGIDVIYRCTKEFEKQNSQMTWRYNGLPPNTESVAIENCSIELTLETNLYSIILNNMNKPDNITTILNDYLINFKSIAIRKVKELKLHPHFKDLLSRLRGNASVLFEDVELIKVLPSHTIEGPYPFIQTNKMEKFNFTMKRVNISLAEDRAILWGKENIPIFMNWENINLESGTSSVEIIATTIDRPLSVPEDNQVYIRNCTFKSIGYRSFILNTTVFHFTDNYVDTSYYYGFDIRSPFTNISGNTFNRLNNHAFAYIGIGKNKNNLQFNSNIIKSTEIMMLYFGDYNGNLELQPRVSLHGNKFQCRNNGWLVKSNNDTANMLSLGLKKGDYERWKEFENIFLMNSDNICTDFQTPIAVRDYEEFYLKHGKHPESITLA